MFSEPLLADLSDALSYRPRRGRDRGAGQGTRALVRQLTLAQTIGSPAGGDRSTRSGVARQVLNRIAQRSPEVIVKVSGTKRVGGATLAHLRYLARVGHSDRGDVSLENEQGARLPDHNNLVVERIAAQWESWELEDGARRSGKVANSLIFSMPPGTDPEAVFSAVRATAAQHFSEHRYILAQHRDTEHPHVHLVYALRNIHGIRTFLSHEDKQLLRESFAENLRAFGVDANATLRKARGLDDSQRPRGAVHRAREGRDPSPPPGVTEPVQAIKRDGRTTRLRGFVRDVFDRSINELRHSRDPDSTAIAASLERFAGSMPGPGQAGQGRATLIALGGETIDVAALDPAMRQEILVMAARAAERDEGELVRKAGVTISAEGRRDVLLGGERIDIDKLDHQTRRVVLEVAASARERDARAGGPGQAPGAAHQPAAAPPERDSSPDLRESARRLADATRAIERAIRSRSRDREGPSR